MKLTAGEKDLVENLLKHDGFTVLENLVALERERLVNRLTQDLDVEKTAKVRGEIQALDLYTREALTKLIRDTP